MKTILIENGDDSFTQNRKIEKQIKALQIETITINIAFDYSTRKKNICH